MNYNSCDIKTNTSLEIHCANIIYIIFYFHYYIHTAHT